MDLMHDLIPFNEKKYPVLKDSKSRALAGLSMGGGQSLNIGFANLGQFAWIGGFSSAPNTKEPGLLFPKIEEVKRKTSLIWISCGEDDTLIRFSESTHDFLYQNHVPHIFYIEPGGHD